MANSSNNILVGAAELAVGTGTPLVGVDGIVEAIKSASTGTPKDFRGWANSLDRLGSGSALGSTGVTFNDVGFTQEGVELTYTPDFGEVEVDQLLDSAKIFKQKVNATVKTQFAESTLENLTYAWDLQDKYIKSEGSYKELYVVPGELGDAPNERVLAFVGNAPAVSNTSRQRLYVTTRAVSMEASTQGLKRNEASVIPVTFRLLPDGNSSYSAYGKIVDQL